MTATLSLSMTKEIYPLGVAPPLGYVPGYMYAAVIREDRFGEPCNAFQLEEVRVPEVGPNQVLVWIMAAGTNYNNVWAALGSPVNLVARRQKQGAAEDFHIGGSEGSGVVWAVGREVNNVQVGDHVVLSSGMWDESAHDIRDGGDPIASTSFKVWGYEENWGSFAQFALVDHYQCLPKPKVLTWEAAAAYMLVGATAYRMLHGWPPHVVQAGDVVLVWGGAGGLGTMGIQLVCEAGGIPIAVVSDESKYDHCFALGARGVINRKEFRHWGRLPNIGDTNRFGRWMGEARAFGQRLWEVLGERRNPRIILEHAGEDTLPTSIFVCDNAGMIVICGGTSGYNADVDLRYLWMRQKRLQGSHFANREECAAVTDMIAAGRIEPVLSRVFRLDEVGDAHQLMHENRHPPGNMAILVNAPREGLKDLP